MTRLIFTFRRSTLMAVVAILIMSAAAFAQSGSSTITGIVKDITGAPIAAAGVKVTNGDTNVTIESLSNEQGLYRVGALVPGTYRVEITFPGFAPLDPARDRARSGPHRGCRRDARRRGADESLEVKATAPVLDTQSAMIAQTVTREMVAALPLPNRAASSLAALAPGVIMIDTGSGTAENYPVFSVAGGRARNQNFILDGGNATNAVGLTRPQQLTSLPVDAMQEFRVISNNYSAEYGHSTGGVITMSTRSGTSEFRGSVFESLRNDALDAKNFFAASKAPIHLNQFGGSLGGPVKQQKDVLLRDLGEDPAADERCRRLHRADAREPVGRLFGPA